MARSRNIKPGFFRNDKLADCGPLCMIVFSGLWCIADYRGNLEYRPKRIKVDTIPYFDCIDFGIDGGIEGCIDILEKAGFVQRYTSNDTVYLHIAGFDKHQNPHKNERDAGTSIPCIEKADIKTESIPSGNASDRADSLILIPDSLVSNEESKSIPFEEFWNIYPRKTNKQKAAHAWNKLKPSQDLLNTIHENISERLQCGEWSIDRKDFIPHASTFLNGQRWDDEIVPKSGGSNGKRQSNSPVIDHEDTSWLTGSAEGQADSSTGESDIPGASNTVHRLEAGDRSRH